MSKKKITLEVLARMVAEGFAETASRQEIAEIKKEMVTKEELKDELAQVKTELVTKSYLDDKLADLEGSVIVRQRKEDRKMNLLIEFLKKKKVLGKTEVRMLQEIRVFPVPPRVYK